ncbi:MAG: formylglycine-generating enzyme family protein [Planctomycetes bacterium]|nr:formylglycine-generating enzyme family protein [Planctomycetota bacterium]
MGLTYVETWECLTMTARAILRLLIFGVTLTAGLSSTKSTAQATGKYPTIDPPAHKSYAETIERDGVKASFEMIAIPGGSFLMGSPASEKGRKEHEGPQHPVTVKPLWVGKCEVTWGEYDLFWEKKANEKPPMSPADKLADAITRPSKANHHDIDWGYGRGKNQPVVAVHYHAAMEYCRWLSAKTGKLYRLPTEAEWEWACRAGTTTAYSLGDDPKQLGDYAWTDANSNDMPHPVGMKKANAWGLYDMHGNVAEWCMDHYDAKVYSTFSLDKPTLMPLKPPSEKRYSYVVRGGSWIDAAQRCRSAERGFSIPDWQKKDPQIPQSIWWNNADWVGFRVVRAVEEHETLKGIRSKITKQSPN